MSAHLSYDEDFTSLNEKSLVRHCPYFIYDLVYARVKRGEDLRERFEISERTVGCVCRGW
jgi:hypothetical protein